MAATASVFQMEENTSLLKASESVNGEQDIPRADRVERNIFYILARWIRCLPTAYFHFLWVEFRPVLAACIAAWYLKMRIHQQRLLCADILRMTNFHSAVAQEVGCGRMGLPLENDDAFYKVEVENIVLVYCLVFYIIALLQLFWYCGGCATFEDAKYLKFTYDLEHMLWYRIAVFFLAVLLGGGLLYLLVDIVYISKVMTLQQFHNKFAEGIWAVGIATIALQMSEQKIRKNVGFLTWELATPDIEWHTEAFMSVRYTRTILDLLFQSNDAFANKLMVALWTYHSTKKEQEAKHIRGDGKLYNCVREEDIHKAAMITAGLSDPPIPAGMFVEMWGKGARCRGACFGGMCCKGTYCKGACCGGA